MNIERLQDEFDGSCEVSGFRFVRIDVNDGKYCYKVTSPKGKHHFEVFKAKIVAVCIDFDNRVYSETEFKEVYPKYPLFGISAWCINDYDKAILKFNEL